MTASLWVLSESSTDDSVAVEKNSYQRTCLFIGGMLLTPFIRLYEVIRKWSSAALVIEDLTLVFINLLSSDCSTSPLSACGSWASVSRWTVHGELFV